MKRLTNFLLPVEIGMDLTDVESIRFKFVQGSNLCLKKLMKFLNMKLYTKKQIHQFAEKGVIPRNSTRKSLERIFERCDYV